MPTILDKLCIMCGEEKATTWIMNPNSPELWGEDEEDTWSVCETCKEFVEISQGIAIAEIMSERTVNLLGPDAIERHKKHLAELYQRLEDLSKSSGKEMMMAKITRKDNGEIETDETILRTDRTED